MDALPSTLQECAAGVRSGAQRGKRANNRPRHSSADSIRKLRSRMNVAHIFRSPGRRKRSRAQAGDMPLKVGPRTLPGVQTHQFFALGAAVATRRAPEGQEAANLDPRGSNFEIRSEGAATPSSSKRKAV